VCTTAMVTSMIVYALIALLLAGPLLAQTSVAISNTVQQAGVDRPGINIGNIAPYGQQQMLKDFGMEVDGYFQPTYWQTTFPCTTGGRNDTTHWYNSAGGEGLAGYPANFWYGASYIAINALTGTAYGTGRITASTSNSSAGTQFTLGTALSSPCNTAHQDMLVVKFPNAAAGLLKPQQMLAGICSSATWNTSDTSPESANTYQSLEMPSGCTLNLYMDQVVLNNTNTNAALAAQWTRWINVNGSYKATFKAKCLTNCSITYSVIRASGPTYVSGVTVKPDVNTTHGAGWTTYSTSFTGREDGASNYGDLQMTITVNSGIALLQDATVIEGSTLNGNNTIFRDAFVRKLQAIHPGSLRFMDEADWCSTTEDMTETAGIGGLRNCVFNSYVEAAFNQGVPYWDKLQLCLLVDADCWLTVGQLNQASDWAHLVSWLGNTADGPSSGTSWIQAFAEAGHRIYLEDGNETWNTSAGPSLWAGNGPTYGYFLGPNMRAAKIARGYDASIIKLVGNSWGAPAQGYGPWGWLALLMKTIGCTASSRDACPDYVDNAPYTFSYLGSFVDSSPNVSAVGAPFLDEWAEIVNTDSVPQLPCCHEQSMVQNVAYAKSRYNVGTAVYEVNYGTVSGKSSVSQLQMDQIVGSVGEALAIEEHLLLMRRDSRVTGPINVFQLAQNSFNYNGANSPAAPLWGIERTLACGPGQLSSCPDVDRPLSIAMQIVNNALGSNSNAMSVAQSGTPTFRYSGGQVQSGENTILANSAVPYVQCFAYANSAKTNWTAICFNNNLKTSNTVTLSGAGAPNGNVTETLFGNGNSITDHNENTYIGSRSLAPVVSLPGPTLTSGTRYTIPPATMMVLTYSTVHRQSQMSSVGSRSKLPGAAK